MIGIRGKHKTLVALLLLVWGLSTVTALAQGDGAIISGDWRVSFYEGLEEGACPPGLAASFAENVNLPIQVSDANGVLSVVDVSQTMGDFQFVEDGVGRWIANDEGFLYDVTAINQTRLQGVLRGDQFGCKMTVPFTMFYGEEPAPLPPVLEDLLGQQLMQLPIRVADDTPFQVAVCEADVVVFGFGDGTDVFAPVSEELAHTIQTEVLSDTEMSALDTSLSSSTFTNCSESTSNYTLSSDINRSDDPPLTEDVVPATGDHTVLFMARTPPQLEILLALLANRDVPDLKDQLPVLLMLPITLNAGDGDDAFDIDFDGEILVTVIPLSDGRYGGDVLPSDGSEELEIIPISAGYSAIDMIRYGMDSSNDTSINGSMYLDEFESFRTLAP